jgi:hypothetical protein
MLRDEEDHRVVMALIEAGIGVTTVYDLVNTRRPYPEAIGTLLRLLPDICDDIVKEGVVRALTVKEARGRAGRPLLTEFTDIPPDAPQNRQQLKATIGNALIVVATRDLLEDLLPVAADATHGWPRQPLLELLGTKAMRDARSEAILLAALDDRWLGVVAAAIASLGKLGVTTARARIRRDLDHADALVRRRAKAALAKLDKSS